MAQFQGTHCWRKKQLTVILFSIYWKQNKIRIIFGCDLPIDLSKMETMKLPRLYFHEPRKKEKFAHSVFSLNTLGL